MSSALVLRVEVDAQNLGHFVETRASVGDEGVVFRRDDHPGGCVVVLVLDVADDHFDEILDRDEPVGAAILVDDERHMGARRLHPHQKVDCGHRAGHEEDGPQDLGRG